ncbi:piggyBac transposable element-derived protein 3-like [Schistocerca piceifrons]|uniref:piggyBac transposable element-derived protein 3-like n=1 Tax=Schistocerca piceifrons TaxID=274613 RepID=UPI001F5F2E26|nr:piggyBac transposable element-derived protein 3-like [Schistocerca piceifrons]
MNFRLIATDAEILQILEADADYDLGWSDDSDNDPLFEVDLIADTCNISSETNDLYSENIPNNETSTTNHTEVESEIRRDPSERGISTKCPKRNVIWFSELDTSVIVPPFTGEAKVCITGESPLDFFMELFPEKVIAEIVEQTNLCAHQKGKEYFSTSVPELKIYFGITLITTKIRRTARRFLHFKDVSTIPPDNTDKAIRLRPILEAQNNTYHKALEPEVFDSVDEMVIPFKGRSSLKQYFPKKLKKWGYKMWLRAGVSSFVYCFELFQGAGGGRSNISECRAAGNVVCRLCHDIHEKNHEVYADKLFSSIPLVLKLKKLNTWYIGTIRNNTVEGAGKKLKAAKELQKKGRVSSAVLTSTEGFTVTRWIDHSPVTVVSSYAGREPEGVATRFCRKEKKFLEIKRPHRI